MSLYRALRPALFRLSAETAHTLVHRGLQAVQATPLETVLNDQYSLSDERLETTVFGCDFPNPVGVAAGFDKNAEIPHALGSLGFGHVEVGGVTARAQAGNPRPRMFRLAKDDAIINRMGFNNDGADAIGARLEASRPTAFPLGVNIGKSKDTAHENAATDYRYTYERVKAGGDFFVVNVSSPNTPGLRSLQDRHQLEEILSTLDDAGAAPLLVKFSPDLNREAIADGVELASELELDGIVATNTTTSRPDSLSDPNQCEEGGLSGAPIEAESTQLVRFIAERSALPVIGVGGVASAEGAYQKIRAGASLVQLYTGLVYEGPSIARSINTGLLERLERDGFDHVSDAVGADLDAA